MEILQSTQFKVPVKLVDSTTGAGVTGKTYAQVTVYLQKQAGASTAKSLAGGAEWVEVDATNAPGKYDLLLTTTDTNTKGFLFFTVAASACDTYYGLVEVKSHYAEQVFEQAKWAQALVESHRGHHTFSGRVYYVDGTGGSDSTGDGTYLLPYKTISKALTQVTSNNHDLIWLLANASGGPTVITEAAPIAVSKNYVFIRGPGRDVQVTLTGAGNVFEITGDGVELSGFRVTTAGAGHGVSLSSADFCRLHRLWIESAHNDAVMLSVSSNARVESCYISGATGDGIHISSGAGAGGHNVIHDNHIDDCGVYGIHLDGVDASDCAIHHNMIHGCPVGIYIAAATVGTFYTDNRFAGNTVDVTDLGSGTNGSWNLLATDSLGRVTPNSTTGAGAAINTTAASYLLTTGTQSLNTYTATQQADGTLHEHTDTAGTLDLYYEFSVGTDGIPVTASILGRLNGSNDTLGVYAYDYSALAWRQVGTIAGTNGTTNSTTIVSLLTTHVSGAGAVRLRLYGTGLTSATLRVDYLTLGYARTSVSSVSGAVGSVSNVTSIVNGVWDEAIAGHVAAGSTGEKLNSMTSTNAGAFAVTLRTQTALAVTVPSVLLDVYDAANTALVGRVTTGAGSGSAVINLDAGTYQVRPFRAGYTYTTPQEIVVAADGTKNITLEALAVSAPSSPNECVVFGYLYKANGDPAATTAVTFTAITPDTLGDGYVAGDHVTAVTDANGYFEIGLLQGISVRVRCHRAGIRETKVVPATASQNWATW